MLLYMSHSIRGQCNYIPVPAKNYAEYQEDKKQGIMNTLIKIAPNFKKLMSNYVVTVPMAGHDAFVKHTIRPFVRDKLCPAETPENRKIITKHIGTLIKGLEKANKAEEEKIAINLETYLTQLVSTKYGTFTGGRKRRRRTRRKRRRKKTKRKRRKRKKRGATKKRKHPEGSQDEPSSSRRRMRIRELRETPASIRRRRAVIEEMRRTLAAFEMAQPLHEEERTRDFFGRYMDITNRYLDASPHRQNMTIEDLEIFIHDTIKLRDEMQEFIRKYDFEIPLESDPNFPHNTGRSHLNDLRSHIRALNRYIRMAGLYIKKMEDSEGI